MINEAITNTNIANDFEVLRESIEAQMRALRVPGVAVGLLHGDKQLAAGFGVTNIEHPLPVTPRTLFQIGSITKTLTGTAAMRLVEQGKLDLDRPVRAYVPELRLSDEVTGRAVTLRHLLTHTGGWPGDYFFDGGRGDDALARFVGRMAELPQLTPLGSTYAYNNAGFGLAGRVIEVVAGKPFEDAMQALVLDPLGMRQTYFFPEDVMTHSFATGHSRSEEGPTVARPWALTRSSHAVGGAVSSVLDMLRYARFHLGDGTAEDGTPVLTPATLRDMREPQAEGGGYVDHIGITWQMTHYGETTVYGHGGATNGQSALFRFVPDQQFALVILTNHDDGSQLCRPVLQRMLDHFLGLREPEIPLVETTAEDLAPYAGKYEGAADDIVLAVRDGHLTMEMWEKGGFPTTDYTVVPEKPSYTVRLGFRDSDRVVVLDPPAEGTPAEFLRDEEGRITWFRYGGRLHKPVRQQ